MRFLITRPAEDAAALAAELSLRGHETIIEPVMSIVDVPAPSLSLDGVQALLITSANGIRAFARAWPGCSLTVLAVGDASGRAARDLGFGDVRIAGGDVETLAEMVIKDLDPASGALLHIAGTHRAGDLSDMLVSVGFAVRRQVLYEARASDTLGPESAAALENGALDAVLLYSPRTAVLFCRLVADAGLADRCQDVTAFCLSSAVADKAAGLPWAGTVVAETPDQAALLRAIETASR